MILEKCCKCGNLVHTFKVIDGHFYCPACYKAVIA